MKEAKPIETPYKGYMFKTRLKARWAVFFDALGVKWEYEPEGYELDDGTRLLPDFILHNVVMCHGYNNKPNINRGQDLYVLVRTTLKESDSRKIIKFHEAGFPIYVVGNLPDVDTTYDDLFELSYEYDRINYYNFEAIDNVWCGGIPGISHDEIFCIFGDNSNYLEDMDIDRTWQAYDYARQLRFEMGETLFDDNSAEYKRGYNACLKDIGKRMDEFLSNYKKYIE